MRRASGLVLAGASLVLPAAGAAQDDSLEEIIVTGTRITRPDFVSASPIVTIPGEVFAQIGSPTVETALNLMPQFVPGLTGTSNGIADGQATADLRGLGPGRTLVLLDGRRLIASNGDGVVDLNIIPPALVENVEVITGGASATYGSDAIAGVVNFKLLRSFDGVQFAGSWGQTSHSDGDEYDLSITAGTPFADGRGSVMGFVGYSDRGQVNQGAREFANVNLFYVGPGNGIRGPKHAYLPFGSDSIAEGAAVRVLASAEAFDSLFASYGYPNVPWQRRFGFNSDGTLFTVGPANDEDTGLPVPAVFNFRGTPDPRIFNQYQYFYNFAPKAALQMPFERWSAFLAGRYDVGDTDEIYMRALFGDYRVNTQFTSVPLQDVYMPVTNPYIPPDLALLLASREDDPDTPFNDADAPFRFIKRMTVIGPRVQENQYAAYQVTGGLRGKVFSDWNYDTYAQFGESDQTKYQTGNVLRSRVMELTFAPDGGTSICGGFNPFGLDSVSPGCAKYVATDAKNHATVRETIVEATMDGPLAELPAGDLRAAVGLMYRDQSYRYRVDENLKRVLIDDLPDVVGLGAAGNIDADDHNFDVFLETFVPIAGERPGVKSLYVDLGYRYSDYASAGGVSTWKAELLYQPVDTVRLRGSYQRAVAAPSIFELYQPRLSGDGTLTRGEPCSEGSPQREGPNRAQVEALCIAQGMPAALLPHYYVEDISLVAGGNPDLQPERDTTYTAGAVFQPKFASAWFDDVQLSVDWYQLNVDSAVQYVDATDVISNCYDPTYNPTFSVDNFWCSTFGRNPVTGEITGATSTHLNLASLSTSGIDTELQWSFPAGPGRLSVSWFITWVASYQVQSTPGVPPDEFAGTVGGFGGSQPEWKWNLHVGYTVGGLGLGASWRYIDSMVDGGRYLVGFDIPRFDVQVPHYDYFDLEASYDVHDGPLNGLSVRAGIENLADKDPPIFPSWSVANTDASQYDVLGRRYFLSFQYRH